ncbi:apolipoprotein N-acyltransferase [Rhodocyclaceae bacterium SMB388]
MRPAWLAAALAGACSVLAFSPFDVFVLAFASLAVLFLLLRRAVDVRSGFVLGLAWGMGAFLAGVSWLYIALNRYGGVPMPVAALAIAIFCAYLALYPGLVGAAFVRLRRTSGRSQALLFAGLWVLAELARGWVFTGFPWLAIGYSQTPPSPFAGWFAVVGVYGVGGLVALVSALLVLVPWRRAGIALPALLPVVMLIGIGLGLGRIAWTDPVGAPLRVVLAQTNIEQGLKWQPEMLDEWLGVNARMAGGHDADLVVLPETSLPLLVEHLPDGYLDLLRTQARRRNGDLIVGVFSRDAEGRIYNAAISLGVSAPQFYAKQHLVPFGEYSPPLFGWFYRWADIPMSDQTPGAGAAPMKFGDQLIAINICYEDLFGRALLPNLPDATLMLNLSNLAWYGHSLAQPQHLQIARVRAIETGRPMLRSTNTGMTALVMPDGRVDALLPQFVRGALAVEVRGYQGMTPYARWGDLPALVLALAALVAGGLAAAVGRPD